MWVFYLFMLVETRTLDLPLSHHLQEEKGGKQIFLLSYCTQQPTTAVTISGVTHISHGRIGFPTCFISFFVCCLLRHPKYPTPFGIGIFPAPAIETSKLTDNHSRYYPAAATDYTRWCRYTAQWCARTTSITCHHSLVIYFPV